MGIADKQYPIKPADDRQPGEMARITVSLWDNGGVSCSGNIGDERLAKQMLDAARDAVTSHHARMGRQVIIPGSMVSPNQDPRFPFGEVCKQ